MTQSGQTYGPRVGLVGMFRPPMAIGSLSKAGISCTNRTGRTTHYPPVPYFLRFD
jgi:hypothetical protein